MASVVEICNAALGNIGVQQTIASLDEKSKEASACKRFYEQARNELLRARNWPFATRFVQLALVETFDGTQAWDYSYRYPADCEKVRRVIPSNIGVDEDFRSPFIVLSDDSGKLIYSNIDLAKAEITFRITNPSLFDSLFVGALGWLVAHKIAPSLSGNNATAAIKRAKDGYDGALELAGGVAADEESAVKPPYSEFMMARE